MIRVLIALLLAAAARAAEPVELCLPTENRNLLNGRPEKFYMYVDRTYEGVASKPWQGGGFGFVRTPVKVNGQMVLRQFHEGIDIAPVKRDKAGNPLDLVSSIAAGTVVHTSPVAGRSNYGKYVVVAHDWENSRICSLYAHLAEVSCKPGDVVKAGGLLGRMGYTGAGINRTRAHLHLELGMLLSSRYEDWHAATGKGLNHHGIYNGMNLGGADAAGFFLAREKNPHLKFSEFIAATPVYFKVTVPAREPFDLLVRHPWLQQSPATATAAPAPAPTPAAGPTSATTAATTPPADGSAAPATDTPPAAPVAWEISFSATGLPTRIAPSQRVVAAPVITQVRPGTLPHRFLTRNLVTGEGSNASLTAGGLDLVKLITGDFPATAAPPAATR